MTKIEDMYSRVVLLCPHIANVLLTQRDYHRGVKSIIRDNELYPKLLLPNMHTSLTELLQAYQRSNGLSISIGAYHDREYRMLFSDELNELRMMEPSYKLVHLAEYGGNTLQQAVFNGFDNSMDDLGDNVKMLAALQNDKRKLCSSLQITSQNMYILMLEFAELSTLLSMQSDINARPQEIYKKNLSHLLSMGTLTEELFQKILYDSGHRMTCDQSGNLLPQGLDQHKFTLDSNNVIHFKNRIYDPYLQSTNGHSGKCPAYEVPGLVKSVADWTNSLLSAFYW